MTDAEKKTALFEAAEAVTDQVTARAFLDAVFNYGCSWHPDDSFTGMVNADRERTFTDTEAKKLDVAADKIHSHLRGDEVYDYGLEMMKSEMDRQLLVQLGSDHTTLACRVVPVDDTNTPSFKDTIELLLKQEGEPYEPATPDEGFTLTNHPIAVWETPNIGPCMELAYAIAKVDQFGRTVAGDTYVTRSTSMFRDALLHRLGRPE